MDYPSAMDVLAINDWVLREAGTVPSAIRDDGVLEAAMMRPRTAAYNEDADLRTQAAILTITRFAAWLRSRLCPR